MATICRLCLSASSSQYQDMKLLDQRQFHLVLPEIDLNSVRCPLICSNCSELLNAAYQFKTNCLETERLINTYAETFTREDIDLNEILKQQFVYKDDDIKNVNVRNGNNENNKVNDIKNIVNVKNEVKFEGHDDEENYVDDNYAISDVEDYMADDPKQQHDKQERSFMCAICAEAHKSKQLLLDHVSVHFRRPKCAVCKETLSNLNELKEHSVRAHEIVLNNVSEQFDGIEFELDRENMYEAIKKHSETYKDDNRGYDDGGSDMNSEDNGFNSNDGEKKHNNLVNNFYKCEICEKVFNDKIHLNSHMKGHFYRLKCVICNKLFCTIQSFRKHILSLHKNLFKRKLQEVEDILKVEYNKDGLSTPDNCPVCNNNIKSSKCSCKNDVPCNSCNKTIPRDTYFRHKLVHLIKNNNFDCEYCQKRFMRKSALTRHIEEVHLGIRKQYTPRSIYTCDICGLTTHRKSRLTQHMRTHTGEKPYKCDECGKAFAQSSQLGVHKRTRHSDHSRFTCEYCSKPLKSKYSLDMHILIMHKPEELERKFGCHVCEKKFRFAGELTNHLTWHSEDRRFSCEVCGKRFVNQPSVKKHMVIHSGEKKHKCEICGKGFHHKSYIKVHMKVHKRIL